MGTGRVQSITNTLFVNTACTAGHDDLFVESQQQATREGVSNCKRAVRVLDMRHVRRACY